MIRPADDSATAEPSPKRQQSEYLTLADLGLAAGAKIEVSWTVQESADGEEQQVWWGATLKTVDHPTTFTLDYEEAHGFDAESRAVRFTTARVLYDVGLSAPLAWRTEGDASASAVLEEAEGSPVPAATGAADGSDDNIYDSQDGDDESDDDGLQLGAAVKARSQGGDAWVAGSIAALNGDGTVDVLYEHSHTLEQGVPREFVQLVDGVTASEPEGAAVADTIDSFFEMFVSALTSGALFQKMTPEQQAVASEKVRGLRPHFEAELTTLKEARGIGASVSGDDIRELLPRVMARAKAPPAPAPTQTASAEVA